MMAKIVKLGTNADGGIEIKSNVDKIPVNYPKNQIIVKGIEVDKKNVPFIGNGATLYSGMTGKKIGVTKKAVNFPFSIKKFMDIIIISKLQLDGEVVKEILEDGEVSGLVIENAEKLLFRPIMDWVREQLSKTLIILKENPGRLLLSIVSGNYEHLNGLTFENDEVKALILDENSELKDIFVEDIKLIGSRQYNHIALITKDIFSINI